MITLLYVKKFLTKGVIVLRSLHRSLEGSSDQQQYHRTGSTPNSV